MICKCGSEEFYKKEKGIHVGIYCSSCDKWQKWDAKECTEKEIREFIMPFGKYKDTKLEDIPITYIAWLRQQKLKQSLEKRIDQILRIKQYHKYL